MRIIRLYALVALLLPCLNSVSAKQYQVESPSGKITANIDCGYEMTYSVSYDGKEILSESPISISLSDGTVWGKNAKVSKAMRESVENIVENPFGQSSHIIDSYNGLTLRMKGGWSVEFRAYDDGLAYRFASIQTKPFEIVAEDVVRLNPAGVVILAGTNDIAENLDILYNEERTLGNILSMAEIANANGIQVFLSSVLPVTNYGWKPSITNHKDKIEHLNARIKEYAEAHDMPYIDYYSSLVYGDRDLNYALTGDGVHPNAEGYRIMEGIVLPIIRERIKFEGAIIPEQVTLSGTALA